MPIVSSTYSLGPAAQVDGRQYVVETHTDQYGTTYAAEYLAAVGADFAAIMAARADVISQQLIDAEIAAQLNGP